MGVMNSVWRFCRGIVCSFFLWSWFFFLWKKKKIFDLDFEGKTSEDLEELNQYQRLDVDEIQDRLGHETSRADRILGHVKEKFVFQSSLISGVALFILSLPVFGVRHNSDDFISSYGFIFVLFYVFIFLALMQLLATIMLGMLAASSTEFYGSGARFDTEVRLEKSDDNKKWMYALAVLTQRKVNNAHLLRDSTVLFSLCAFIIFIAGAACCLLVSVLSGWLKST